MIEMDKEEAALQWMAALRSGKYKQGQNFLRDGNSFCCLGVAADVYQQCGGNGDWDDRGKGVPYIFRVGDTCGAALLPHEVRSWLGLGKEAEHDFVNYNDIDKMNFEQIAEKIEMKLIEEGE